MLTRYNTKGKIIFVSGFHRIKRCSGNRFFAVPTRLQLVASRATSLTMYPHKGEFYSSLIERDGNPRAEKVVVEKIGDDLGLARAVLLKKSNDGMSVPGRALYGGPSVYTCRQAFRCSNR